MPRFLATTLTLALVSAALPACAPAPSGAEGRGDAAGHDPSLLMLEPADPDLRELAWMTGHWASRDGELRMEEHWTQPAAGSMMGINRMMSGERTLSFEFLRIVAGPDGVVYLASPGGRNPPTPFPLVDVDGTRAVFENPDHDFPRRITYWLDGDGSLNALIEGDEDGERREEHFSWRPARLS